MPDLLLGSLLLRHLIGFSIRCSLKESGRCYPIFVGSTKTTDMLRSISWLQFSIFLLVVLLVYYGYWAWRFPLASLRQAFLYVFFNRGERAVRNTVAVEGKASLENKVGAGVEVRADATGDGAIAESSSQDSKGIDRFQETDIIIQQLKAGLEEAVASGLDRAGIERGIKAVLAARRHLMGTPFEPTINAFIERTCRAHFGWQLPPYELAGLWGGGADHQGPTQPVFPEPD